MTIIQSVATSELWPQKSHRVPAAVSSSTQRYHQMRYGGGRGQCPALKTGATTSQSSSSSVDVTRTEYTPLANSARQTWVVIHPSASQGQQCLSSVI